MSGRHQTQLASWEEWKELCSIQRCGESAVEDLLGFAEGRINHAFSKLYGAKGASLPWGDDAGYGKARSERWHLVETYMHTRSSVSGKRWKDWLFERAETFAGSDLEDSLEKLFCRCIRTVAQKYSLDEGHWKPVLSGNRMVSADEPVGSVEDGRSQALRDLIPSVYLDPCEEAAWNELQGIALRVAEEYFAQADFSCRILFLAEALGITVNAEEVLRLAERGRDSVYRRVKEKDASLRSMCKRFSDGCEQQNRWLTELAIDALKKIAETWGKSEKRAESLFLKAESEKSRNHP